AEKLILEGALPHQVDRVLYDFGFPMGPFAMGDLAGLDVGWRIRKGRGVKSPVADRICELGRFGQKTGAGYYKYDEKRNPTPDPDVEKIIVDVSTEMGITRRPISDEEILQRLLYPMVNEGAKILDEKMALRASDASASPKASSVSQRTSLSPAAPSIASTDARVNLYELSVQIVSPASKRTVMSRSRTRTVWSTGATRCISTRASSASQRA